MEVSAAHHELRQKDLRALRFNANPRPGQGLLGRNITYSEPNVADYLCEVRTLGRRWRLAVTRRMENGVGALNRLNGIAYEQPSLFLVVAIVGQEEAHGLGLVTNLRRGRSYRQSRRQIVAGTKRSPARLIGWSKRVRGTAVARQRPGPT